MASTTLQTVMASPATLNLLVESTSAAENKETPDEVKLPTVTKVPTFTDKYEERKWAKEQMAGAFRVFARLGYCDGVAGHMSLRGVYA